MPAGRIGFEQLLHGPTERCSSDKRHGPHHLRITRPDDGGRLHRTRQTRGAKGHDAEALFHGSTTDRTGVEVADDHAVTAEDCAFPSANILFSTVHLCVSNSPFSR